VCVCVCVCRSYFPKRSHASRSRQFSALLFFVFPIGYVSVGRVNNRVPAVALNPRAQYGHKGFVCICKPPVNSTHFHRDANLGWRFYGRAIRKNRQRAFDIAPFLLPEVGFIKALTTLGPILGNWFINEKGREKEIYKEKIGGIEYRKRFHCSVSKIRQIS